MDNREQVKNRVELPWDDSYGDHIRILDGIIDGDLCDECIRIFDEHEEHGLTHTRRDYGAHVTQRSDTSIFITEMDTMTNGAIREIGDWIHNDVIESWQIRYPVIDSGVYSGLYNAQMKMQKTRPSEGYHNWHFEGGSSAYDRTSILAYMVYLNDVEDGGETEFLYYPRRLKAEAGTLLIFPGNYTHTHRGNQPLSGPKYTINTWLEF